MQRATKDRPNLRQKATIAHVTIASLLFPMVVLVSVSGGLLLAGMQGSYQIEAITPPDDAAIDVTSPALEEDVKALLEDAGIGHSFKSLDIEQTAVVEPEEAEASEPEEKEEAGRP